MAARRGLVSGGVIPRRLIAAAAAWAATALAGCGVLPSVPGASGIDKTAEVRTAAPPGFSGALRASLPSVLGVYGLARTEQLGQAGRPSQATRPTRGEEQSPWSDASAPATIGAGFFIDDAGSFVTAAHVVADAVQVLAKTADSSVFVADLIDRDEEADVAVLRLRDVKSTSPRFGRSANPSACNARQCWASWPGARGIFPKTATTLSIPIEAVLQIAAELRSGTARQRPRLGAGFEDVSAPKALSVGRRTASGALITSLRQGSVARQLRLQLGDIVVGVNDRPIEDSGDFARWLMTWRSVTGTRIVVWREHAYQLLEAP